MREKENIFSISELCPQFLGFIFYPDSKRFVGGLDPQHTQVPEGVKKVGVFVNSSKEEILGLVEEFKLNIIQLHGDEQPEQCKELQEAGIAIIKAFSVDENFDFDQLNAYKKFVSYFLFDTKGKEYGGNGITFNWQILDRYKLDIPFFLSGGIDLNHIEDIKNLKHKQLFALDLNSRFEIRPGYKDVAKLKIFVDRIKA
ncbi:MAG: phosphoribosylanthranilate isomerase [Bacteroidota bacterium]|nr:phosphoribosylanthranilate isomerase [Bacteroidota bacterium]